MSLMIQMMIQKIEVIIQEIIYFLTRRLANKMAFFMIGILLNVQRDRHQTFTMQPG